MDELPFPVVEEKRFFRAAATVLRHQMYEAVSEE
jgi:hypothetical protein